MIKSRNQIIIEDCFKTKSIYKKENIVSAKNLLNTVLLGSAMPLSLQASAENAITETTGATIAADQQQMTFEYIQEGDPVYVSENANVWIRSCAKKECRIIGAKHVGDELKFLKFSDNKEFIVIDDGVKQSWMLTRDLQPNSCGKAKVLELQAQVNELQNSLANYDSVLAKDFKTAQSKLEVLEKENNELKKQLQARNEAFEDLDAQRREMKDKLQTRDQDMQMRWWMQGAIIAFCGAIIGIICVYIPRPGNNRKKSNRY